MPLSLDRAARHRRAIAVAATVAVYAAAFPVVFAAAGPAVGAFGALPGLFAAWQRGRRWGLGTGVLVGGPLHVALYSAAIPEMGLGAHVLGAAPTAVVFGLLGYGLGRVRELAAAVRASEARYRSVVETVRDAVVQTDAQGRWTYLSPAWERITGHPAEDCLDRPALADVHPDDRAETERALAAAVRGETPFVRVECRCATRQGGYRHVEIHAQPRRDEAGHVVGLAGVVTDVTDSVRFEAERVARERTEEVLRLKGSFLNNMSHELRTPLTGILGFAEMLADEVDEEQREFVGAILRGGHRLQDTLNAVLDLAQLDGGDVQLRPEPVDVASEVREAADALRPAAADRGLSLAVEASPAGVLADRPALRRVLDNLIGNALKFTDAGGVVVRVERAPAGVCVHVSDTGCGIAPAFLPHLYSEFRQASEGLDRAHEGNGLGLAITRRLVCLMGGEIGVESEVGVGTTFTVTLPPADGDGACSGGRVRSVTEPPPPTR